MESLDTDMGGHVRLAQSVEHSTLNLRVVGSSPTLGKYIYFLLLPDTWICKAHNRSIKNILYNKYNDLRVAFHPKK